MAGPKPGGDKQALMDAYGAAKAQNAPAPDADAAAEQAQGVTDGDEGGQQLAGDPAMKSLQLQVQHLEHVLLTKGILSPTDLINPPAPMPPAQPPMGAPAGAPPGAPMAPPM